MRNKYYTVQPREVAPDEDHRGSITNRRVPYIAFSEFLTPEQCITMGFKNFVHRYHAKVTTYTDYKGTDANGRSIYVNKYKRTRGTILYLPQPEAIKYSLLRPDAFSTYLMGKRYTSEELCKHCKQGLQCRFAPEPFSKTGKCTPQPCGPFSYLFGDGELSDLGKDVIAGLMGQVENCTYKYKDPIDGFKYVGVAIAEYARHRSSGCNFYATSVDATELDMTQIDWKRTERKTWAAKAGLTRHLVATKCKTCFYQMKYGGCRRYVDNDQPSYKYRCWHEGWRKAPQTEAVGYATETDIHKHIEKAITNIGGLEKVKEVMRLTQMEFMTTKYLKDQVRALPNLDKDMNWVEPDTYYLINSNVRYKRIEPKLVTAEELRIMNRDHYCKGCVTKEYTSMMNQELSDQESELYVFMLMACYYGSINHWNITENKSYIDIITTYVTTKAMGNAGWNSNDSYGVTGIDGPSHKVYFRTSGRKEYISFYSLEDVVEYIGFNERWGEHKHMPFTGGKE